MVTVLSLKLRVTSHIATCATKARNKVFGGNIMYYRKELENKHIKKLGSKYNDLLWAWLDGKYFNLPTDLYICSIYIPHEKSNVHTSRGVDPYQILAEETAEYQKKGMVLYIGDFNSRTGSLPEDWDFISRPTPAPINDLIAPTNDIS